MLTSLPLNPTTRTLRQFAGGWFVVFLAAAARQAVHGHRAIGAAFVLIGFLGLAGMIKPGLVKHLFIAATVVAFPFGWVLAQVILGIMFYVVLTPIALICRWRGRDSLRLKRDTASSSFWAPRGDPPAPENYLKQF